MTRVPPTKYLAFSARVGREEHVAITIGFQAYRAVRPTSSTARALSDTMSTGRCCQEPR
jgi:hypothetical protein